MATNIVRYTEPIYVIPRVCSHPSAPDSGDPVRYGKTCGIAMTDEGDGGYGATETGVLISGCVADLLVDDNGGSGIAAGDIIYYHDTGTGSPSTSLNNSSSGADAVFGIALEAVSANATTTINVQFMPVLP
jgi:hypothetical protein